MRISTTKYYLRGTQIVRMENGDHDMQFFYDAHGKPAVVRYASAVYGYVYNLQGDIIGIVDKNGNTVVEYRYDAWGKIISKTGSMAATLGTYNPFRYRGYVYDEETGLYYLRSRYYNPEWCRFIAADSYYGEVGETLSHNLFAYCQGNPVNNTDEDGDNPALVLSKKIHDEVCRHVSNQIPDGVCINGMKITYTDYTYGFADVISASTGEVYEIKRYTCAMGKALEQIYRYLQGDWFYKRKGFDPEKVPLIRGKGIDSSGHIIKGSFIYNNEYIVTYWYVGEGIIIYDYHKSKSQAERNVAKGQERLWKAAAAASVLLFGLGGAAMGGGKTDFVSVAFAD